MPAFGSGEGPVSPRCPYTPNESKDEPTTPGTLLDVPQMAALGDTVPKPGPKSPFIPTAPHSRPLNKPPKSILAPKVKNPISAGPSASKKSSWSLIHSSQGSLADWRNVI